MGNGNTDVDNATSTRKPGQPTVGRLSGSNGSSEPRIDSSPKTERHPAGLSGAMSQQGGEFRGNVSAPQKFVQLVGCRDRKVKSGLEAGQYPNPVKR